MVKLISKRLLQSLAVFFVVSVLIFIMVRLSGLSPLAALLDGRKPTPSMLNTLKKQFYLDQPLVTQYFRWISDLLHGNMGTSYKYLQPINTLLAGRFSVTLGLTVLSTILMVLFATIGGIVCAIRKNSIEDRVICVLSLFFLSTPSFLSGIILILIIGFIDPSISFSGSFDSFGDYVQRLFIPSVVLSLGQIAIVLRLLRSSMIEQMQSAYVMTAVAKGLGRMQIIFRHALRNAVIPALTVVGMQVGIMLSGTVLIETVFSLPGVGSLLMDGVSSSDYPIVQGLTMIFVLVFLVINLIVDICYALIDPRIRLKS